MPTGLSLSPNGKLMATIAKDRKVSTVFFDWKGDCLVGKISVKLENISFTCSLICLNFTLIGQDFQLLNWEIKEGAR